jgi:sodium/potassium/calcium exchanger 2
MMLDLLNQKKVSKVNQCGVYVHKHRVRAVFRTISFLTLITIFYIVNSYNEYNQTPLHRRLEIQEESADEIVEMTEDSIWKLAPYLMGVLYMFAGLAIVCDEYFVPALAVMSGEYHLDLAPDISGATLMAAGGSAPELFTNFVGTFQESEVGFGTIVGSAVFNILFVIGMCSLLSHEVLQLTWWPLFRDSSFYALALLVLAIFVGAKGSGEIDLVEAEILFVMYLGYIFLMSKNEQLYEFFSGISIEEKILKVDDEFVVEVGEVGGTIEDNEDNIAMEEAEPVKKESGKKGYKKVNSYCHLNE